MHYAVVPNCQNCANSGRRKARQDRRDVVRSNFFFQAEDGIRAGRVTWSSDVCSSDLAPAQFESTFLRALHRPVTREDHFLGGEAWGSLQDRVLPCFRELLADRSWHHLLVVAHGGVNRVILLEALGGGLSSLDRIEQ